MKKETTDVFIIGAGPAGSLSAALLTDLGYRVIVAERQQFPRFVIGESLLPQCMNSLEKAGLLAAVEARGYQRKTGALFCYQDQKSVIDFGAQFTPGYAYTYQVPRSDFDHTLAKGAAAKGADLRFQQTVKQVDVERDHPLIDVETAAGESYQVEARFILDASGYGRVLPRLLDLDKPSSLPPMASLFTHVHNDHRTESLDSEKIMIGVHPDDRDVWYWLIPFASGVASVGIVAKPDFFANYPEDPTTRFCQLVAAEPNMARRLANMDLAMPPRSIVGYSSSVKRLYGRNFALLGNAGEFLDPVFSSGVTMAMKSAEYAVATLDRQLKGQAMDWEADFSAPLMQGVDVFGSFVRRWYDGSLQAIIFRQNKPRDIYEMICSVLAGYVWDETNPYCKQTDRRLGALAEICAMENA